MQTIHRYPLFEQGIHQTAVAVRPGSQILRVGLKSGAPQIWIAEPESSFQTCTGHHPTNRCYDSRLFRLHLTGDIVDERLETYVGTFILDGGDFVGHVYEVKQ